VSITPAIPAALAAAVLYGVGAALQQHNAAAAPRASAGRPALLLLLMRRPWWLLGIGAEVGGFATHAVALRWGPLGLVQMLTASSLIVSVATVRLRSGRRLGRKAWAASFVVVGSLATLVALASPGLSGGRGLPHHAWLAAACLAAAATPFVITGLAAGGRRRAVLLAAAAGLADTWVAVVTMVVSHAAAHGVAGIATSWATYALIVGGPCSLLLTQTAYQAARPMITLPLITVITPMASIAVGAALLGETARLGPARGAAAGLAAAVTAVGLTVLARCHSSLSSDCTLSETTSVSGRDTDRRPLAVCQ
jgi:hypothetical protein